MNIINSELLAKSYKKAYGIIEESSRLRRYDFNLESIHIDKCEHISDLVGDDGVFTFTPTVKTDISQLFKDSFKGNIRKEEMMSVNSYYYREVFASFIDGLTNAEMHLSKHIYQMTSDEDLIANRVNKNIFEFIKQYEELKRKYNSPKLSKILVKLWGENSNVVKWYTNECPKQSVKGENPDYKITISTLPHHIIGMSYYSPVNHGGERWTDGWQGSSCMDTIQNSDGENIVKLPSNLRDSFQAIAFLHKSSQDSFDCSFLSRMLLRFVNVNGKWIIIGLRAYNQSSTTKGILLEGLANQFDNFYFHKEIERYSDEHNVRFVQDGDLKIEINDCDDDDCDCEGMVVYPYNDHQNFITFRRSDVVVTLPKGFVDLVNGDENKQ